MLRLSSNAFFDSQGSMIKMKYAYLLNCHLGSVGVEATSD